MEKIIDTNLRSLRLLTEIVAGYSDSFSFIMRHDHETNSVIEDVKISLSPKFISQETVTEWPGTSLSEGTAVMYKYRFDQVVADILCLVEDNLDDWIHPDLPEDLVFYHKNQPFLVSITHEHDCYFEADAEVEPRLKYYGVL